MRDGDIPPLPDDVAQLLRTAGRPRVPAGFAESVLVKVKATVAVTAATALSPTAATALGKWGVASALAGMIGGAAAGVWAGASVFSKPVMMPMPIVVERRVEVRVEVPTAPPQAPTAHEHASAPAPAPAHPPAPAAAEPPPKRDADLAQERVLIEMARTALSRHDVAHALEALATHAARFPNGQLSEERESLQVQALASSGRLDEARLRAAEFRARFPNSLLLPAVDAALEPLP
jgi:hypothetical protein